MLLVCPFTIFVEILFIKLPSHSESVPKMEVVSLKLNKNFVDYRWFIKSKKQNYFKKLKYKREISVSHTFNIIFMFLRGMTSVGS